MSVTAFPVILVDSGGSDTLASGAGPSTALTGSAASSTGTTVVLDAGTDLSGVAVDGSHVLFFNDSTTGNRNFAAINGKSGSGGATPTVALEQSLASTTKAWAIGGKRATVDSATSLRLIDNNSSTGDAAAGWTIEMQSGYAATWSGGVNVQVAGSTTNGPFTIRGKAGAATRPVITLGASIIPRADMQVYRSFDIKDGASHTVNAFNFGANAAEWVDDITADDATNYFNSFTTSAVSATKITRSRIGHCVASGVGAAGGPVQVSGSYIHDCGAHGIDMSGGGSGIDPFGIKVTDNIIANNGGRGVYLIANGSIFRSIDISRNTVAGNTSHGIEMGVANNDVLYSTVCENNILASNGGYGVNWSGSGITSTMLASYGTQFRRNDFYSNTSGPTNLDSGTYIGINGQTLNPSFVGGGDYTPTNTALAGTAYPPGF